MTPMSRLKNNLDLFSQLLNPIFKEVNLNKSAPKSFTTEFCGEYTTDINRGVENDFVKLFKTSDKDKYIMAFVFDYIDLPEAEQKIHYSIKVDQPTSKFDYIITTDKMTVNEFKEKLNSVNSILKDTQFLDYDKVIKIVTNEFIPDFTAKAQSIGHIKSKRNKMK